MDIPEDMKELMVGYLKSAQNALVNVSATITKITNEKEAQMKQLDDAIKYYTEQKVKIQADVDMLTKYGLVVPEEPKPENEEPKEDATPATDETAKGDGTPTGESGTEDAKPAETAE